jgi:acetate kinase
MTDINILLLNAGSSSLKCPLMEAASRKVIAHALTDWAGTATHYKYTSRDGHEQSEEVSCSGHAEAAHDPTAVIRRPARMCV